MSVLLYLAADTPLDILENPHDKMLSVNEALELGLAVPDSLLAEGIDRDMPGMLHWSDREVIIDIDRNEIRDGDFDDDFSILPLSPATDDIYTEKEYRVFLEWIRYTEGRALQLIDYLRWQLQYMDEVELWHAWLGCEARPKIKKRHIAIDDLTPEDLKTLNDTTVTFDPIVHHCCVITKA